MIHLRYFAHLREALNCESESIEWRVELASVDGIKHFLSQRSPHWQQALTGDATIIAAVNQQLATAESTVNDGDQVAFFPPVTGG